MTFPRLVLGIDAGPTTSGYAILDFSVSTAPVWVAGGSSEDVFALLDETTSLAPIDTLVVVEEPRGRVAPERAIQVMQTCFAAGDAHGFARARGFHVLRVGVNQWRQAVVGHSERGDNIDRKVERVLRSYVRGMPTRTNVHARDAAGVAWAGLLIFQHHPPDLNVRAKRLSRNIDCTQSTHRTQPRLTDAQRANAARDATTLRQERARIVKALAPVPIRDRPTAPEPSGATDHADEDRR